MKRVFQIVLIALAVFLTVLAFRSIMRPEKFRMVYEFRKNEIRNRLVTLRVAQAAYKNEYKTFATDIDSLAHFVNHGTVAVVKIVGTIPEKMSETEAFKLGLIKKEVTRIPAKNKILESDPLIEPYLKDFQFIPFTNGKKFEIQSATIASSTYTIPVYRIEVQLDDILANMNESLIPENSTIMQRAFNKLIYNGLAEENQYRKIYKYIWMGSLTEANTAGSWEALGN